MENKLKEKRKAENLTQKQVADKLGIAESAYQKYEYGMHPSVIMGIKIAQILNATVEELWNTP